MRYTVSTTLCLVGPRVHARARIEQGRCRNVDRKRRAIIVSAKTGDRIALKQYSLFKGARDMQIYPEWGSFPDAARESPFFGIGDEQYKKFISAELMHGRFAMLGVAGVWAQESFGLGPWYEVGQNCQFDKCSIKYLGKELVSTENPGALLGLIMVETVAMGLAEGYRTGLLENPFPELEQGSVYPGGRFDPLNFGCKEIGTKTNPFSEDLDTLKIKELKHCRLAMFAWLGIISQTVSLNIEYPGKAIGALDAWRAHISNVLNCNVVDRLACFSN